MRQQTIGAALTGVLRKTRNSLLPVLAISACIGMPAAALADSLAPLSISAEAYVGHIASTRSVETCNNSVDILWRSANELVSVVPGVGSLTKLIQGTSKVVNASVCMHEGQETFTMAQMVAEMERVAAKAIDEALRKQLEIQVKDLLATLVVEQINLENLDALTPTERQRVAIVMQTIGNDASRIEAEAAPLQWPALPALVLVGGIKNAAYALSYELSEPGFYRDNLKNVLIPQERAESIAAITTKEAQFKLFGQQTSVGRSASVKHIGNYSYYEIHAYATRGPSMLGNGIYEYRQDWYCKRHWLRPRACNNFKSRQDEFFPQALATHRQVREDVMKSIDDRFLNYKNGLDFYQGKAFFLINNRRLAVDRKLVLKCLDVNGNPGTAARSSVQLLDCEFDLAEESSQLPTDQLWRFIPHTGLIQNVLSGLCLDVIGNPAQQVDGSQVTIASCETGKAPEDTDQRWGLHPQGYLVNLVSGRCLDLQGSPGDQNYALAQVAQCQYSLSSMPLSFDAAYGIKDSDQATDQAWHLRFVD